MKTRKVICKECSGRAFEETRLCFDHLLAKIGGGDSSYSFVDLGGLAHLWPRPGARSMASADRYRLAYDIVAEWGDAPPDKNLPRLILELPLAELEKMRAEQTVVRALDRLAREST